MRDAAAPATAQAVPTLSIVGILLFNFVCYFNIGLPLAVVPGFVAHRLGLGAVLAGAAISAQYVATLLSRAYAGHICDRYGSKRSAVWGLLILAASAVWVWLASVLYSAHGALGSLIVGRLLLGAAESLVTTGTMTWAIRLAGPAQMSRAIAWNGMSSYGGIALGAPLGVALAAYGGLPALAGVTFASAVGCLCLAVRRPALAPLPGLPLGMRDVLRRVFPLGCALALGSVGFGVIASFIALYYQSQHWDHAAWALTLFGACFIVSRLLFAGSVNRFGGFRVAYVVLAVETLGLGLIWQASTPAFALVGVAITSLGFALLFPSLGIEAVARLPAANRGAALGVYSLFLDLSLGLTGPLAGAMATHWGYATVYLCAGLLSLGGLALTRYLGMRATPVAVGLAEAPRSE